MDLRSKKNFASVSCGGITAGVLLVFCAGAARADWMSEIGFTQLQAELGANMVTGAGITVAQVEETFKGGFIPETSYFDFAGKTFLNMTPDAGNALSDHATNAGISFYGNSGIAPGITSIDMYEAFHWIQDDLNYYANSTLLPGGMTERVADFDWTATEDGSDSADSQVLQRFDYILAQSHVLAVIATDKGGTSAIPTLLASAYNGITVGLSNSQSSHGLTRVDGAGRIVPDIVATGPMYETSYVTPIVGAAAALLYQAADLDPHLVNARSQPLVIKAILMAGAAKSQYPNWSRTPTQPLDTTYGAGELNVYNSYHILKAGQFAANSIATVGNTGWDYASVSAGTNPYYYFDLLGSTDRLSVMLNWNCVITNSDPNYWNPVVTVPHLNLKLYSVTGFTLGSMVDSSVYTDGANINPNNEQCIYQKSLPAGRYALEVSSLSGSANYALAWQSTIMTYLPGDTNHDGVVNSLDIDAIYQHLTVAPSTYQGTWPWPLLTWSPALTQYDPAGLGSVSQADVTYELNDYFHTNYGDANLDGVTGFVDFQALLNHWQNTGAGWAGGDFNGDGVTDFLDFQMILNYWNPGGWNFAPSEQVPEPATVALVLAGGLFVLRRRQRRGT